MFRLKTCCACFALIIVGVLGFPTEEPKKNEDENCIQMTDDKQIKINTVVDRIASFINHISTEYEDIDLRLIGIDIDRHSSFESKKDTTVKITINDCVDGMTHSIYKGKGNEANTNVNGSFNGTVARTTDGDLSSNSLKEKNYNASDISVRKNGKSNDYLEERENSQRSINGEDSKNDNEKGFTTVENRSMSRVEGKDSSSEEVPNEFKPENIDSDSLNDDKFDDFNDNDDFEIIKKSKSKKVANILREDEVDDDEDYETADDSPKELFDGNDPFDVIENKEVKNYLNKKSSDVASNDTEAIRFVNFKDRNNINICEELIYLNPDDKIFFEEVGKKRGDKPFILYQRFFNNTIQYWFL